MDGSSLRVVFFCALNAQGVNGVLQMLRGAGVEVPLVVTTPGPKARRTSTYQDTVANILPGTDVLVSSHPKRLYPILKGLEPDLIFVASFPWRLPVDVLELPRLGSLNTHPAPLPRYRGPDPVFWQIYNGEPEIGLTVHRMAADFDTGPIMGQGTVPLAPEDDFDSVMVKLMGLGGTVLTEAFGRLMMGDPGTPQDDSAASYAPVRTEAERVIDWSKPAAQLHNQVRAWGSMGAWADLDGKRVLVRRAQLGAVTPAGLGAKPGTIVHQAEAGDIEVQTGEGLLRITDYVES